MVFFVPQPELRGGCQKYVFTLNIRGTLPLQTQLALA